MIDLNRDDLLKLTRNYFEGREIPVFNPGETYIPASGKVLDASDCVALVDASLDMWLTAGRYADLFEKSLADKFGTKYAKLTVSGSAANLLAFSTLTSPRLGDRRIVPGSEVITVAAGFPTTVNPIVQNGCIPVFVDVGILTHNILTERIEAAITSKTRAIMVAHALGNPFDAYAIKSLCDRYGLFLIEDCCDAFGASINSKNIGTFGDIATLSFYPAHHITTGEGGAVMMNNFALAKICESFRDWGRDCYCEPGKDNTCGNRFGWSVGDLPEGYDHKYIYSHIGYNLKMTDMQAALGLSQLSKLDYFVRKRRSNFQLLIQYLKAYELDQYFHFPEASPNSEPSWFGCLLTIKDGVPLKRKSVISELEDLKVGTRLLFAGNLTKQPAYRNVKYKISDDLKNTDKIMRDSFWIGVWPGLDENHLAYMAEALNSVVTKQIGRVH